MRCVLRARCSRWLLPNPSGIFRKEIEMIRLKTVMWLGAFLGGLFVSVGSVQASDIGGTISATLIVTEDSQLVDDVTCTVTSAPCIAIAGPNVTLELNCFTMTGQAD